MRGCAYYVKGVTPTGGVQIEGLPVIGYYQSLHAALNGLPPDREYPGDVGWKPHRFRNYDDRSLSEEDDDSLELELVGAGTGR